MRKVVASALVLAFAFAAPRNCEEKQPATNQTPIVITCQNGSERVDCKKVG